MIKNSNSARHQLLVFYEIEQFLGKLLFWRPLPSYRVVGPNGDAEYLYREGDRLLWICSEWVSGPSDDTDIVVYTASVDRWDPPFDHEVVSREKRQEILERLGKYLAEGRARVKFQ